MTCSSPHPEMGKRTQTASELSSTMAPLYLLRTLVSGSLSVPPCEDHGRVRTPLSFFFLLPLLLPPPVFDKNLLE